MRASSENQTSIAAGSTPFSRAISSRRAGKFFYIPRRFPRLAHGDAGERRASIAHGPKFSAQGLLGDRDAELLEDPLAKIDDPPAYDTMYGGDRPALDDRGKRCPVCIVEPRGLSGRFAVDQPFGAMGVELHYPVANNLQRHAADLRRFGARGAIADRRQCQKPPRLRGVLRSLGRGSRQPRIKINPERYRHGEPPSFAMLNQTNADLGIPPESQLPGFGIRSVERICSHSGGRFLNPCGLHYQ